MFEGLAKILSEEIDTISHGQLQCLPYSKSLLDCLDALEIPAKPLVVRTVVFGKVAGLDWETFLKRVPWPNLFSDATNSPHANGWLDVECPTHDSDEPEAFRLPYRTLGFPHGAAELGAYHADRSWYGHLVVVVDKTMIDLSIAQINSTQFGINFKPDFVTTGVTDEFLSGEKPLIVIVDGMLAIYRSYPNETTFETSNSFAGPAFPAQLKEIGIRAASLVRNLPRKSLHSADLTVARSTPAVTNTPRRIPATPKGAIPLEKSAAQRRADRWESPCRCGSGRKYKNCHGKRK
jgi:hypothetical protein